MAAFSYSVKRGGGLKISDFTHGTLAPNADDIELRINTTDANGAAMQIRNIIDALAKFEIAIMSEQFYGSDWGI